MGDGKGRPQAGSCPTQGGLMPVKDGAQPAFIFTAGPYNKMGERPKKKPRGWAQPVPAPPEPAGRACGSRLRRLGLRPLSCGLLRACGGTSRITPQT